MAEEKKERNNPFLTKTMGKGDEKSRQKAERAAERADQEIKRVQEEPLVDVQSSNTSGWPSGEKGTPMMHAEMSAAELIPTGQYANVSVGPARVHFLIDPDRELRDDEDYFTPAQRATIAKALNEAAEVVGGDVIAVQRNIVLENMQSE
jgi:hypothetical protein